MLDAVVLGEVGGDRLVYSFQVGKLSMSNGKRLLPYGGGIRCSWSN